MTAVFERFTDRARRAVVQAQEEARMLGHGYIGTEHLLLGLLREQEGVAAEVLSGAGASLAEVRGQVAGLLHGSHAVAVAAGTPRRGRRGRGRAADEALAQLGGVDQRLAAIERWVGMAPDTSDLDQQLAGARRAKEAAIDAQDFSGASELRDTERRLIAEKGRRERQWPPPAGRVSLAGEAAGLAAEVQRLTGDVQRLAAEVARLTAMVDPPGRAAD